MLQEMSTTKTIYILVPIFILCIIEFIGTRRGWKILIDPPDDWYWFPLTVFKRKFGEDLLLALHYLISVTGMILIPLYLLNMLFEIFILNN